MPLFRYAFTMNGTSNISNSVERRLTYEELEDAAATILGKMLFALSRLEVAIAFYIVWAEFGKDLEALTAKIIDYALSKKLDLLQMMFGAKYKGDKVALARMAAWLDEANSARELRNKFVHGRWGIADHDQQVANVTGLPTSPAQREERYSIPELQKFLSRVQQLEWSLAKLRKKWPLYSVVAK